MGKILRECEKERMLSMEHESRRDVIQEARTRGGWGSRVGHSAKAGE